MKSPQRPPTRIAVLPTRPFGRTNRTRKNKMAKFVRSLIVCVGLVLVAGSLSGCVVEEGHCGGWWHHCH
jgi:hypothetical protein